MKSGKDRPTKSEIKLKNGSIIRCLPTGLDGLGIRGYTVDLLIADEAAFIPEDVWPAITPMLSTTGGNLILLSTPFGRSGYFYECFNKDNFSKFHVNTEDVAESRPEPQKTFLKNHLEQEKKSMSNLQYSQEYLGDFVDELRQLFPDELIKRSCTLKRRGSVYPNRKYCMGMDVGGLGEDPSTYEIIDYTKEGLVHVESQTTEKTFIHEVVEKAKTLDKQYNFKKIHIDDGGLGFGVFSYLLKDVGRKVIPINNASRALDREESGQRKRILKEDLYMNLLSLLERGELKLLDDDEIFASLKSVQREYIREAGKKTVCKIYGNNTHIVEGLTRAAWIVQDKGLNIWCR